VATIAAEAMKDYLVFGKKLVCHLLATDKIHQRLFMHWKKKFKFIPRQLNFARKTQTVQIFSDIY
jgi:hypothetical protein